MARKKDVGSDMQMMYLVPRYQDYWEEAREGDERYPNYLELACYRDDSRICSPDEKAMYYRIDLGNLNAAEEMAAIDAEEAQHSQVGSEEYRQFSRQVRSLQEGKAEYFIRRMYYDPCSIALKACYPEETDKAPLDFLYAAKEETAYACIFVAQRERLLPQTLCRIMETYSVAWFGQQYRFACVEM